MDRDLLRELASRLRATPAELVGLAVLLSGVAAVTVLVWWTPDIHRAEADGRPAPTAAGLPVGEVTVHVSGAVASPGVVTLPDGSRVTDAVAAVGGTGFDADLGGLNLARILQDGEQIEVPRARGPGEAPAEDASDGAITADGRVDLNRATGSELETLPGVGPVLAARILEWREEHGRFREAGELREVSGIGERTFQRLVELIVVR